MAELTKTEFLKVVEAYFGAKDHAQWVAQNGSAEEYGRALLAVAQARQAMIDGVSQ